jgi:hypothetical protein
MRDWRAAMKSVSTAWAAADFSGVRRGIRIAATAMATAAIIALASFVAVAISLT